jgi:hypothetical protein
MKVMGLLGLGQEVFCALTDREGRAIRPANNKTRVFLSIFSVSEIFFM